MGGGDVGYGETMGKERRKGGTDYLYMLLFWQEILCLKGRAEGHRSGIARFFVSAFLCDDNFPFKLNPFQDMHKILRTYTTSYCARI